MNPVRKHLGAAARACGALLLLSTAISPALGHSIKARGSGTAGIAFPQDATAARLSPSGMVFVGNRVDLGLTGMTNDVSYSVTGAPSGAPGTSGLFPETVKSKGGLSLAPNLGVNWMLGSRRSVGLVVYGSGTMFTDYPGSAGGGAGTFGGGPAGVSTEQLFLLPTYSEKMNETSAWGVSAVVVYHRFRAKGLGQMAPYVSDGTADNLSDMDYDVATGIGAKFGLQSEVHPGLTLAASYQTRVRMSKLDRYADLFAEQGGFDVPPTLMVGFAWQMSPTSTLMFDFERTWHRDVASLGNSVSNFATWMATGNTDYLLGGDHGAGFGWRNTNLYKLGYQWQASPTWTLRAGTYYGRHPIPSSEVVMNVLASGIQEWRMTAGFTKKMGPGRELTLSLLYAPRVRVSGTNPLDPAANQTVELRSSQLGVETSWSLAF